jgi:hypothetical protein
MSGLSSPEAIKARLSELNPKALIMPEFDDALVGVGCRGNSMPVAVYNERGIINLLIVNEGLSYSDAWDHYGYNIAQSYMGEHTPIIIESDMLK